VNPTVVLRSVQVPPFFPPVFLNPEDPFSMWRTRPNRSCWKDAITELQGCPSSSRFFRIYQPLTDFKRSGLLLMFPLTVKPGSSPPCLPGNSPTSKRDCQSLRFSSVFTNKSVLVLQPVDVIFPKGTPTKTSKHGLFLNTKPRFGLGGPATQFLFFNTPLFHLNSIVYLFVVRGGSSSFLNRQSVLFPSPPSLPNSPESTPPANPCFSTFLGHRSNLPPLSQSHLRSV